MPQGGDPSHNLLAQAGLVTNEAGRVFEAPCGRLDLPWLLRVGKETARQARQVMQENRTVDEDTRFGWFIVSTQAEFSGLQYLLQKDWRRALQAWKGNGFFLVHNRATLHRALYYSSCSERPEAHLRECLRLYYHLSELDPKLTCYRTMQEELVEHLKGTVKRAHQAGDDESCSRSMKILYQTVGMVAVSHLQTEFFARELESLRRNCARVQKELLAYQGVAHSPPESLLEDCSAVVVEYVVPEAARFSHKLVEGSKEREEVETLVARTCGILAQSFVKAQDNRSAKKWMGEALRWEPKAVEQWRDLPEDDFYEDDAAQVSLPQVEEERTDAPRPRGSKLFGIQCGITHRSPGDSREEWLESFYLARVPLLPLKRFAAYRNLDTLEVGYYVRIPLKLRDYFRQGLVVLIASFIFTVMAVTMYDAAHSRGGVKNSDEQVEIRKKIDERVQELKKLAQREAKLNAVAKPSQEQRQELKTLQQKRLKLIQEVEELEQRR